MKQFMVSITGYTKGVKKNSYRFTTHFEHTAVARAMKQFRKDYPNMRFDETHIVVSEIK